MLLIFHVTKIKQLNTHILFHFPSGKDKWRPLTNFRGNYWMPSRFKWGETTIWDIAQPKRQVETTRSKPIGGNDKIRIEKKVKSHRVNYDQKYNNHGQIKSPTRFECSICVTSWIIAACTNIYSQFTKLRKQIPCFNLFPQSLHIWQDSSVKII